MMENLATIWSLHYPNPNSTHSTLFLKVIEISMCSLLGVNQVHSGFSAATI